MALLSCEGLVKDYPGKRAVDGVSFYVERGEIVGLLGPNGAGKSTTIHLLSTLLKADSGEIIIDNKKVGTENEELPQLQMFLRSEQEGPMHHMIF